MRAVTYHRYGTPDVLEVVDAPRPVPGPGQVLLRIHAASVNPWDWDRLTGTPFYTRLEGLRKPPMEILGADVAGTVVALGDDTADFDIGDEVLGDISSAGWGGFAEYVAVDPSALATKPTRMSWIDAASLPQAGVLALQGLDWRRHLTEGETVLINGAGGGVGTLAIQIAKHRGCHVVAVDAEEKADALRSLGADRVIDFRTTDFTRVGERYDLILDVISRRAARAYARCMTESGRAAVLGGSTRALLSAGVFGWVRSAISEREIGVVVHRPSRADTERLVSLWESGSLNPVIHAVYPLEGVGRALADIGMHEVTGKAVVSIG